MRHMPGSLCISRCLGCVANGIVVQLQALGFLLHKVTAAAPRHRLDFCLSPPLTGDERAKRDVDTYKYNAFYTIYPLCPQHRQLKTPRARDVGVRTRPAPIFPTLPRSRAFWRRTLSAAGTKSLRLTTSLRMHSRVRNRLRVYSGRSLYICFWLSVCKADDSGK